MLALPWSASHSDEHLRNAADDAEEHASLSTFPPKMLMSVPCPPPLPYTLSSSPHTARDARPQSRISTNKFSSLTVSWYGITSMYQVRTCTLPSCLDGTVSVLAVMIDVVWSTFPWDTTRRAGLPSTQVSFDTFGLT